MSRPTVSGLTERIYELLEPLHADDEAHGYGLLMLTSAAAAMMEEAHSWTGADHDAEPWQRLVGLADLGAGKPNDLLAQMLGLPVRLMEPGLILFIMERGLAHMRGTTEYLRAVLSYYMGASAVDVYERVNAEFEDDATGVVIRAKSSIPAGARRVINEWKPAGLISHVIELSSPTYFDAAFSGFSYDAFAAAAGPTYDDVPYWDF